jgi:hypothetical protein
LFREGHENANSENKYKNTLKYVMDGFELRHLMPKLLTLGYENECKSLADS